MTPLLVVCPHLDDAVLSCGRLLAATPGAVVCTVFAGRPPGGRSAGGPPAVTEWDALCGFGPGDDVVGVRRAEDAVATRLLRARARWLDFVDAQYGPAPALDEVAAAVAGVVREVAPRRLLTPLGLFHRDHRWTAAACLRALTGDGSPDGAVIGDGAVTGDGAVVGDGAVAGRGAAASRWSVYADVPYTAWAPVRPRLAALDRLGLGLAPPAVLRDGDLGPEAVARRAAALRAYRSQHVGLASLDARAAAAARSRAGGADTTWRVLGRVARRGRLRAG